jgi:glyoxylase-like metal-dependent hydrolase (beta-lactamase superfamily II)
LSVEHQIGEMSLRRIVESEEPLLSPFEVFPDCEPHHLAENLGWLAPRFMDAAAQLLVITIQSFLIRRGGLTILLDTCSGNDKTRKRPFFDQRSWPWLDRLRAAGVTPEQVDIVLCSHLHVDHVGWNTRLENGRWIPTFPNARYLISRREWEYWKGDSSPNGLVRTGDYIIDSVLPIFSAGQAELIDETHAFGSDLWLEPTTGHTPGHFALHLSDARQHMILSGDLMHHPLQLRYPDWSTRFCADPATARTTRRDFLARHADTGTLIFPAHFPSPTGGFVERRGDHYCFRFEHETQDSFTVESTGARRR